MNTEITFICDRCGAESAICCTYRTMPVECVWTGDVVGMSLMGHWVEWTVARVSRIGALIVLTMTDGNTVVHPMGTTVLASHI